jgi:hypothetical protein
MRNPRPFLFLSLLFLGSIHVFAQRVETVEEYINAHKELAIAEMQRTGIPAAIKLAQGIHETSAGTSELVLKSNNHFGIKCKTNWTGRSVRHDDDARGECFRAYNSAMDSYKDHSDFLKNSPRYASLFALDPTDYEGWAYGLKRAGYATNPKYPQVIIKLIRDYNLQDYTLVALGRMPAKEEPVLTALSDKKEQDPAPAVRRDEVMITQVQPVQETVYPAGEFRLNETRVIFARKGMSFLAIAEQYKVSFSRIFEFNDMKQAEMVEKNGLIYLQRKRKTGIGEFHVVKAAETIHDIAQATAIRLESLLEYNYLKPGMQPAIGEKLYLLGKAPQAPKLQLQETWTLTPGSQN